MLDLLHRAAAAANIRNGKRRGGSVQQALAGCPLMSARTCCFRCRRHGVGVECAQIRAGFRPMPGSDSHNREEPSEPQVSDRLDSWKEIAAYLRRDERTVRRWEELEG